MLDTNILIYWIKNKPLSVAQRINALDPSVELCMSFITFAELRKGAYRSTRKALVLKQLGDLARIVPVRYQTDHALCDHYAVQSTQLREAGTSIGANDLWIACHALAADCTLVTNNTRDFARVKGLSLENWASESA